MKSFICVFWFVVSVLFLSCQRPKDTTEEIEGRDLVKRWVTAINETRSIEVLMTTWRQTIFGISLPMMCSGLKM